ncbi:MAG: D-alanine--D-alanine ligase [Deltaproteobacteria bacterium]|nr:D-alanine--D-alanine ligase [Deltaproteobacteria bacterium]
MARVAVLLGGMSAEREVSLVTGEAFAMAVERLGHECIRIDAGADVASRLTATKPDVALIGLHGKFGEDGAIQGLLELMGIPYTGSGVLASAAAMDKVMSKLLFERVGIPTAPFVVHRRAEAEPTPPGGYPCIVKPASEGSSVGVSLVHGPDELGAALEHAHRFDPVVLVERYVKGREIQVALLDGVVLGTLEIVCEGHEFYDYQSKYTAGLARHLCPAPLADDVRMRLEALSRRANDVLGCEGATRAEFLLENDREPWMLEINTLPGMTPTSLVPEIAAKAGIGFDELVGRLIAGARLKIPRLGSGA